MSEPKLGAKGWCKHCRYAIRVFSVHTGKFVRGPFWRHEWRHTYSSGEMGERHCPTSTYATPRPHRKRNQNTPLPTERTDQ